MIAVPSPVASDLERFIDLLWRPGDVREVRIPTPGGTDSGYFDDPAALVVAVAPYDGRANLYLTLNPVLPSLLARAANRIKPRSRSTTADTQIVERRWLPIDVDPVRPADISASEEEREAALEVTRGVWTYLEKLGWPEPVVAMSGNGYWLLYPVVLANDDASKTLVDGVLGHLAERFNTDAVSIDTAVSNASRIVALIGTRKVKGDATADRPHRRSELLRTPDEIVPVPVEKLAALVPRGQPARPIVITADQMPPGWVAQLLDAAGIAYRTSERNGNVWYKLDRCPFHPDDDQGGDCGVGEDPVGKAISHCFHNRGAQKTWPDFKAALGLESGSITIISSRRPEPRVASPGIDAADLLALDLPPLRWLVPDLVPEGTTILAAPPKVGKSCLVYQIAVEASIGGELLGRRVTPGSVLYLALEDGRRRGQDRLRTVLGGRTMPVGRLEVRWDANRVGAGLEDDIKTWLDVHPDAVMVAIDTLGKVRPPGTGKRGAYEVDVEALAGLQNLFRDRPVALVIVHHARKEASDDFLTSVSGTYGITGSADTIVAIRRKRLEAFGEILVTGRDIADAEQSVRFADGLWSAAPSAMSKVTFERSEVYEVIRQRGPLFAKAIADELGRERSAVQHLIDGLVGAGAVMRVKGGYSLCEVSIVEAARARNTPTHSSHSESEESEGVRGVRGDTCASTAGWIRPCREYSNHQGSHRRTSAGWTCDACYPKETA